MSPGPNPALWPCTPKPDARYGDGLAGHPGAPIVRGEPGDRGGDVAGSAEAGDGVGLELAELHVGGFVEPGVKDGLCGTRDFDNHLSSAGPPHSQAAGINPHNAPKARHVGFGYSWGCREQLHLNNRPPAHIHPLPCAGPASCSGPFRPDHADRLPRKPMVRARSSAVVNEEGLATKWVTPASARRLIACSTSCSSPMIATSAADVAPSRSRTAR
jgi:hypothetical protein